MDEAESRRAIRFWQRVTKTDACWLWSGPVFGDGYGAATGLNGRVARAHRVAWRITHGPIHEGAQVLHRCDVRRCCNPDHLWLGTNDENMADMVAKGRAAIGDRNALRMYPTLAKRGDDNPSRKHPERLARGDRNGARLHPENLRRGEAQSGAKLTEAQVSEIRARYIPRKVGLPQLAREYGVGTSTIHRIVTGSHWRHVVAPCALETKPREAD